MSELDQLEYLREKIQNLATSHLQTGRPYLLSKLGKDLGLDLNKIKMEYSPSLAKFVGDHLAAEFEIALVGPSYNVQALVPATAKGESLILGEAPGVKNLNRQEGASPRFNYRFWAAFAVPIKQGHRYIDVDTFAFLDTDEKPHGDYVDIEPYYVPSENIPNRDAAISSSIESWLTKHGLRRERFLASKKLAPSSTPRTHRSLLEAVIDSLDRKQLSSTTMSLDVVAELLRRHS